MRHHLKLTRLADQDFDQILDYTMVTWGESQFRKYRDLMFEASAAVTDDPFLVKSKARDDLYQGIRTFPVGRHFLIYRISQRDVIVVRILHQQMNLPEHLDALH